MTQDTQHAAADADAGAGAGADTGAGAGAPGGNGAEQDPATFWEQRYGEADRVWSGRVNAALAAVVGELAPGRSLDLGCGEGGDVLWLAARGWRATGIDLSQTAVGRARAEAEARDVAATFIAADLADWVDRPADVDGSPEPFDLVTASFLQSPTHLPRPEVLRAAAARVAQGGRLVLVSHGAPPSWAQGAAHANGSGHGVQGHGDSADPAAHGHGDPAAHGEHRGPSYFPTPEDELADLALDAEGWLVETAEIRERSATDPAGEPGTHFDTVVVALRR